MVQSSYTGQISSTITKTQFRTAFNEVTQALATFHAGPAAPFPVFPNMVWYDEGTGLIKQRSPAGDAWNTIGEIGPPLVLYSAGVRVGTSKFVGEICVLSHNTLAAGLILCDGRTISRATYSELNGIYSGLGYPYGAGDGTTTFNVPHVGARGIIFSGQGNTAEGGGTGTARSLAQIGGAETHTSTVGESPTHAHKIVANVSSASALTGSNQLAQNWSNGDTSYSLKGTSTAASVGLTDSIGGGQAHNNMSPFIVLVGAVWTGVTA